jgi:hypothetical protein
MPRTLNLTRGTGTVIGRELDLGEWEITATFGMAGLSANKSVRPQPSELNNMDIA